MDTTKCKKENLVAKTDWIQIVKEEIERGGVSWERIPELAVDRNTWKELTALCANIDTGGLRSKIR